MNTRSYSRNPLVGKISKGELLLWASEEYYSNKIFQKFLTADLSSFISCTAQQKAASNTVVWPSNLCCMACWKSPSVAAEWPENFSLPGLLYGLLKPALLLTEKIRPDMGQLSHRVRQTWTLRFEIRRTSKKISNSSRFAEPQRRTWWRT